MALEFQSYNLIGNNFAAGGLNLSSPVTNVADNETPNSKNCYFSVTGNITKRKGFSKLNQSQITGKPNITGLFQNIKTTGGIINVVCSGTQISSSVTNPNGSVIKTGQTAGALYDFAAYLNTTFIVNGIDPNLKYDGTTVTELGMLAPTLPLTATDSGNPGNPNGTYKYAYTYVNADGFESNPSPYSATVTVANDSIDLTNVTVSTDPQVTARNIYRTLGTGSAGTILFFVGTINDNVTTVFNDNVADTDLGAILEYDNDKPPILSFIKTHKNGLFGVEAANPNRMWFSKRFNYSAWPALFFIDIDSNDGDVISGIYPFFDQLVIFKRKSIYILSGTDETNYSIQRANTDFRVGCVAFRSIALLDNQLAFLSERGPFVFDGLRVQYIGDKIESIFNKTNPNLNSVFNWVQQGICCASAYKRDFKNWYFLAIPCGASNRNNLILVYDFVVQAWQVFDGILASSLAIFEENKTPFLYSGDYNGFLWKQDDTNSDGFIHNVSKSTSNTNSATTLEDTSQATILSTATSGGANTLTDTTITTVGGTPIVANQFINQQLFIRSGTGAGQFQNISSNTAPPVTFTVPVPWAVIPDATSVYTVGGWRINILVGVRVKITAGKGAGQIRTIIANDSVSFTVDSPWSDIPDTTSEYSIGFIEFEWDSRWIHYNLQDISKRLNYFTVNTELEGNYTLKVCVRFDFVYGDTNTYCQFVPLTINADLFDTGLFDTALFDLSSNLVTRLSAPGGHIHRYVQFIFSNDKGNQPVVVNSLMLIYQKKGLRR